MDVISQLVIILQTIALCAFLFIIYVAVSFYMNVQRLKKELFAGVKGPEKCHWLFGNLKYFPKDGPERAQYFIDVCNKYGEQGYVLLWGFLRKPVLMACSPRVIGNICKSNAPKPTGFFGGYRLVLPWLGEGLLIASGRKWTQHRLVLTPAFHFEILKPYITVYNKCADTLVKKLASNAATGDRFEVFQHISLCTLEIILKCAFHYDKEVQNSSEANPYVMAINRIAGSVVYRFTRPYLYLDFIWYNCKIGKQFKKDCDFVHSIAEEIIEKRKKSLAVTGLQQDQRHIDFLDILLTSRDENGVGLNAQEIRDEVDTFLFEGHDTTASAVSWILYSLAQHSEWQTKCREEINRILGDRETDDFKWSDLAKMEILTMCIKEGLRLHSPVPLVSRETTQEFSTGDRVFPKGIIVQLNIWALHHMENIWGADHMEFKPERFSKDNIAKMESYQFVPFSAGSRNCIGQHFAMNEMKVELAKLLHNFIFKLDKSYEVQRCISLVMRTKTGMFMFVEKCAYLDH